MLYRLNNIRLKKPTAHAHLKWSVGPFSIDMFGSLIGASDFEQFKIKKETQYHLCIVSEISIQMCMRSK